MARTPWPSSPVSRSTSFSTDLNMPNLDGVGLVRAVRSDAARRLTPVIMVTTESQDSKKQEGKAAGATGWIAQALHSGFRLGGRRQEGHRRGKPVMAGLDQFAANYREEAAERLVELEATLLELETHPEDADLVARAFRALHTIKGLGAMFGFDDIASFTHELETVFDHVLKREDPGDQGKLVSLALEGKDLIRAMLGGTPPAGDPERERLVAALREHVPRVEEKPSPQPSRSDPRPTVPDEPRKTYRVRFKPHADIFQDGTNPLILLAELRSLGRCEIVAHTHGVPQLEDSRAGELLRSLGRDSHHRPGLECHTRRLHLRRGPL